MLDQNCPSLVIPSSVQEVDGHSIPCKTPFSGTGHRVIFLTKNLCFIERCFYLAGPANVEKYFIVKKESDADDSKTLIASFRGRILRGETLELPDGYAGGTT